MIRTFGQYSTAKDLSRRGFSTVSVTDVGGENFWNARPQAIKSIAWPELVVGRDRAADWIESFIESAELQRALANEGAPGWAPIHDMSRTDDGGAYYVTDCYDASARLLAAGRYQWNVYNAEWLRSIVSGVLDALEELQNRRGRAHGNLRPGNILIENILDIEGGKIALSDPATSSRLVRRGHGEHEDMRDLGLVLHQMILHTPFRELGGWPLVDAEAWRLLTPQLGEQWRAYVSWLIDPKAAPGSLSIREARQRLMALPKAKAPVPAMKLARRAAIAAAAVAAVGMVGWQIYIRTRPFDPDLWSQYVNDKVTWAGPLLEDMTREPPPAYTEDPLVQDLRSLVLRSESAILPSQVLGGSFDRVQSQWRESPPSEAQKGLGPRNTALAVRQLEGLRALIERENWGLRVAMRRLAAEDRGTLVDGVGERWVGLAAYVRDVEQRLTAFNQPLPLDRAVELVATVEQIDQEANTLESLAERMSRAGDPFLERFGEIVDELLDQARREENAEEFVAQLRGRDGQLPRKWLEEVIELRQKAQEVDRFLTDGWARVDAGYLRTREAYEALNDFEEPTLGGLEQWLGLAQRPEYVRLARADDPRDTTLSDRIRSLLARATDLRESPALVQRLSDQLDAVEAVLSQNAPIAEFVPENPPRAGEANARRTLEQHIAYVGDLYWVTEQRQAVEQWASAVQGIVSELEEQVVSIATEERRIAQSYVDDLRAETQVGVSASVNASWLERRDALLDEFDRTEVLRTLVDRADAARELLQRMDSALVAPEAVTAAYEPQEWDSERLLTLVQRQRETQLQQVVAALDWSLAPDALDRAIDARLDAQRESYNAWQGRVGELVADMARAEDLMVRLYFAEDQPADGGPTLAALMNRWDGEQVMADVQGREVFASIVDLYEQMTALDAADQDRLVQAAEAEFTPPVVVVNAWRRLGAGDNWPVQPEQLERELAIRTRVTAIAEGLEDRARAQTIQSEVANQGQIRWERAASAANSDEAITAVIAFEKDFGVDRASLNPRTRYNTALADLRTLAGDAYLDQDEQVEAGIRDFIRLARATDAGRYAGQAERMERVLRDAASKPETINLSEYGPAQVGWEVEHNRRQTRAWFTSPNGVRVEFALVRPRGSNDIISKPVFVSTTELSMRVAMEIMNSITGPRAGGQADEIRRQLEEGFSIGATVGINWEGPRSWHWADLDLFRRGLLLNQSSGGDGWLWVNQFADRFALIEPSIAPDQERPGLDHPVNHISPFAADILAKLIGCELPTTQQWQAALSYHEEPQGLETWTWNLRDETWRRQQQYAIEVRRQLGPQASFFQLPDTGIFLPESASDIPRGESATVISRSEPDGVLWFARVDDTNGSTAPGTTLKHMLGNVAEIVRIEGGSGFGVIGGSAMSPPEMELTEQYAIPRGFNQLERSYSDVGMRLSFETEDFREPMSVLLGDGLEGMRGDY